MCRLSYSELFKSTGHTTSICQIASINTQCIGVIHTWFTRSNWSQDDFVGLKFHWSFVKKISPVLIPQIFFIENTSMPEAGDFCYLILNLWKKNPPFYVHHFWNSSKQTAVLEQSHSLKCPWSYLLLPASRPPNRRLGLITKHWECVTYVLR